MLSRKTTFVMALLLLVAAALSIYTVAVPAVVSRQYGEQVYAAARPLENDFKALGKSTELPFIVDPAASEKTRKDNLAHITGLVDDSRRDLALLKSSSNNFEPMPFSDMFGQYGGARTLHDHTRRVIGQAEDALSDYEALTTYLETFHKVTTSTLRELDGFNKVVDINTFGGQSERLRQISGKIRADAALLSKTPHPNGMDAMNDSMIEALGKVADGFDELADGLTIPADGPIYTAARKIENATGEVEKVTATTYDESVQGSRTIRNVQDLSEKLELIL